MRRKQARLRGFTGNTVSAADVFEKNAAIGYEAILTKNRRLGIIITMQRQGSSDTERGDVI